MTDDQIQYVADCSETAAADVEDLFNQLILSFDPPVTIHITNSALLAATATLPSRR